MRDKPSRKRLDEYRRYLEQLQNDYEYALFVDRHIDILIVAVKAA